jgi:fimbrial chaperone protein
MRGLRRLLMLLVLVSAPAGGASAGALSVSPTTLVLPAAGGTAILYVTNNGDQPIAVQTQALAWSQTQNRDELAPSHAIQTSPPFATLAAGQRQLVRVRVMPPDASTDNAPPERSFRLIVNEFVDPNAPPSLDLRVLLQFSVPVFAGPLKASAQELAWSATQGADGPVILVRNDTAGHIKLTSLHVTDGATTAPVLSEGIAYVLPRTSRSWALKTGAVKPGDVLRIAARDDRNGVPIEASVVVQR